MQDRVMLVTANQDQNEPTYDIDHEPTQNEGFFNLKSKKTRGIAWFYIVGVLFHAFYISSIFDIYFQTTLTIGVAPIPQTAEAPAKRVVLFLADGAKADVAYSFYEDGRPIAPFIRSLIATKASYGVSHPRGPTESRTCAIAIWAGFNEDPSAIMSGWKNNIVQYDHILNESTYAWAWGQHGVVDSLYSTRPTGPQTANISLADTNINFADAGRPNLDDWALDSFLNAFKRAETDSELDSKLRKDKVAFFIHMIETDTQGHSNKPYSRKYKDAINHVDSRLEKAIETVNNFYGDDKTLFVFTADHGMLNSGAHGDATPNNTRTPLVVWGPGVMGPVKNENPNKAYDEFSEYSDTWKLNEWVRKDVKQIDITPLVSSLIGIPVPVNSEGRLPLDYLAVSDKNKAQMYLANAQQLCAVYKKRNSQKLKHEIWFSPYRRTVEEVDDETDAIDRLISGGKYENAIHRTAILIDDCVEGALYLQRYDWTLLFTVSIAGYVGWMLFGLARALKYYSQVSNEEEKDLIALRWNRLFGIAYILGAVMLFIYYYLKHVPWKYYGYTIFPVYFWFELLFVNGSIFKGIERNRTNALYCLFYLCCVEAMVVTYYYRETLSLYYVAIALWPLVAKNRFFSLKSVIWVITCMVMAAFPLLPPIDKGDFNLWTAGFLVVAGMIGTGCIYYRKELSPPLMIAAAYTPLTFLVSYNSDVNLHKHGLAALNQLFAWSTLIVGIAFPIMFSLHSREYFMKRLFAIFTCITPLMIILSTSYELLFFACLAMHLLAWVYVEKDDYVIAKGWNKYLNFDFMRSGIIFLYYCHLAFFGMGNIASISGFTLDSIFRFTTQFVPFTMMALLVVRIFLPFVLVACAFNSLTRFSLRVNEASMIGIPVLAIADMMTIAFLFLVDNKGSWLQIGNSITRFIISSVFIILFLIFLGLGKLVMGKADVDNTESGNKMKAKELLSVQDDEANIEL